MKIKKNKDIIDKIKRLLRNFAKSFIAYGLLTFIGLFITSVIVNYNVMVARKCKDFESEYGIERDVVTIMHSSVIRGRMLQYVFSNENFLLNYMKSRELKYYEKIKNKLPKDDFLLDFIEHLMQNTPYLVSRKHNKEFDRSLIKFLIKVRDKKSIIKKVNWKVKIEDVAGIAQYVAWGFYKNDTHVLDFLEKYLLDLINNSSSYNQASQNYRNFLLLATLSSINKRQSLNNKSSLDNTICYDAMYIKWKNRVLEAYSYIEQKTVQYKRREYIADDINYIKEEKKNLDKIERQYCKNIPK